MLAQYKEKKIDLLHLKIKDESFLSILDSVILHEKYCSYYNFELLFSITIKKTGNKFFISIESQTDRNILLDLTPYGYCCYQNHLFLIYGHQCEYIFSTFGKQVFNYHRTSFRSKKENKIILDIFNDDSFSQWHYWYVKFRFILEKKSTFCK